MTQEIVGTRKGDYEILALLGVGGMGQVYKVRNVLSDRIEAMKVLLPNLADQKMLADRFIREIKVLAGLHHPNIAELRTALTIDNQLVMIMEFVEGSTLAARIQEGGLPYGRALGYIQQVLSALSYAHSQRIIHRDIKPANMMLTPKGLVKLMDFGIARQDGDVAITSTNSTVGSIAYMSPEQVKGEPVDPRSDLYSVGVSLYELITGQRPFVGDTGFSIMRAHLETMPKPPIELRPDLPAAISDLILMAVAKDPAKRFQSADAFSRAIASVFPDAASVPVATVAPVSDPTVMMPPAFGETAVPGSSPAPFQATQFAGAAAVPQTAAVSPRTATPSKPVAQPAAAAPQNNYRGFYIALGALIVLVALAAAGVYLPRHLKTQAAQENSASTGSNSASAPASSPSGSNASSSAAQPAASAADSGNNSSATPASSAPAAADASSGSGAPASSANAAPAASGQTSASANASNAPPMRINVPPRNAGRQSSASSAPAQAIYVPPRAGSAQPAASAAAPAAAQTQAAPASTASSGASAQTNAAPANSTPAPGDAAQLQQVETQLDQISSRATAVSTSLDGLRKQQAAQGLTLRGDMTAAEQRMEANLSKAENALQAKDAAQAKHYMDLAEPDVEKLETFLGH